MDYRDLELSYIIPIYQDNEEINIFDNLIKIYSKYDTNVLRKIHFIFVDDCSPKSIVIKNKDINYTLVRITDDIKWNQGGARNLGVTLSKTSKLILTDLDHIFPETLLKDLIGRKPSEIYNFRRVKDGKEMQSHPNTFFCSKSTYFKSLGVDEAFSGNYGYEDVYFIELQKHLGTRIRKYRKGMITAIEHSQHNLNRDVEHNSKLLEERRLAIKNKKPFRAHSRMSLCFEWKVIETNWLQQKNSVFGR